MRVLVVEDDLSVATGVRRCLTAEGFDVDTVSDGADGLAVIGVLEREMMAQIDSSLTSTADYIARAVTSNEGLPTEEGPNNLYVQFLLADGQVLGASDAAQDVRALSPPVDRDAPTRIVTSATRSLGALAALGRLQDLVDELLALAAAEDAPRRASATPVDDGPGIPPADWNRVFERFTTLEGSRSLGLPTERGAPRSGTGLGLSIATAIVDAHHGDIVVGEGGGARLTVRLPAMVGQTLGAPLASSV